MARARLQSTEPHRALRPDSRPATFKSNASSPCRRNGSRLWTRVITRLGSNFKITTAGADHEFVKQTVILDARGVIGKFIRRTKLVGDLAEGRLQVVCFGIKIGPAGFAPESGHHARTILV